MTFLRRSARSRGFKIAANGFMLALGGVVTVLAGRHFMSVGWPLAHADARLVAASGAVFLVAYGVKAYGWKLLFAPGQRPGAASLAAAGGAASITGIALPGRFDDAVRIAVVRRHRGCPAGVKTLVLSLATLGLVDTVALMPLAGTATFSGGLPATLRIAFAIVAAAGVGAGVAIMFLPKIGLRFSRFRLARWLSEQAPAPRAALGAIAFVLGSWVLRGIGTWLLLASLGLGLSVPLAMVFLCAGAASAALPIAPAGAATQAGAGAGALVAAGVTMHRALEFALAAQLLVILAGCAALILAAGVHRFQRSRIVLS